jgi:hypothetical protein
MKETIMNTVDMVIHTHQEMGQFEKSELAKSLEHHIGIDCAEFSHHPNSHSLVVKYDPDALKGMDILQMVRRLDPAATMVGL